MGLSDFVLLEVQLAGRIEGNEAGVTRATGCRGGFPGGIGDAGSWFWDSVFPLGVMERKRHAKCLYCEGSVQW